jgi:hypothetical protein
MNERPPLQGWDGWTGVVVNLAWTSVLLWALWHSYGVSTEDMDGILPTPWEAGWAPYAVAFLIAVIVTAIGCARGYRQARYALLGMTMAYTVISISWAILIDVSLYENLIFKTPASTAKDALFYLILIGWMAFSYRVLARTGS